MGFSRFEPIQAPGLVLTGTQRATLVRRTYSLVFGCVLLTMGGTWFALQNEGIMIRAAQHPIVMFIISFIPLWAAQALRNISAPQRMGLVALFSGLMGVMISPAIFVAQQSAPGIVAQAGILTGSAFAVLTTYVWLSRRDFSAWGSFFMVGFWVLFATSLLNIFFQNQTVHLWIAAVGVVIMSGLLIFDTWRLKNAYDPDEYVVAAVRIYVDLLNMFMFILSLLSGRRNS
jgi:FtsH-binding integral membrane protein